MKAGRDVPAEKIGVYFTLQEMMVTSTGLPNVPDAAAKSNLVELVRVALDPLREHLGKPVRVRSGFRTAQVNRAVGGSLASMHKIGAAADIKVDGLTAVELVEAILLAEIDFDQVIAYATTRGGHVHIGIKPGASARHRKQILWAPTEGGYVPYDRAPRAP